MENNNNENRMICSHCGAIIAEDDDFETINGQIVCSDCVERDTTTCDRCGAVIWIDDSYGDDDTTLCSHCYHNHYTRCSCCDVLLHEDDAYHLDGYDYCRDCYDEEVDKNRSIHDYSYKPEPIFYGDDSARYFGVELEIDGAGKDSNNADELLKVANSDGNSEHIYIKGDGSLDDGMELVTHPMSLEYHKQFQWEDIMKKAIYLGYRSHQTSTCGLHVHVNRSCLGDTQEEQELVIGHILLFIEQHWTELLKFSRRSEYSINRWAARYGYEKTGREILEKAKKGNNGRYAAVNLMNYSTVEFRIFRGTLKYNTLIAALELVDAICNVALNMSEDEIANQSWSDFVQTITEQELITYLKERRLYVNELIENEEDL
ncbi:Putative amidoligase enzyme [Ruminococcus flavefaciens]|uniref:Putative amidoligase enzyme n=1 Tax=Ruminococcus flavefaciens TaxID=1265 RepID=A0A1H6LMY2_RUMFL|nr:amidoligase family protein [Ruminococcus flavefaciens]SEH87676.1 Putative amidoligase enzyme [Ruminococcus flavefaciens]